MSFRPFDRLSVNVYEGRFADREDWLDDVYTGTLHLVNADNLELRITHYLTNAATRESTPTRKSTPDFLRSLPVKVHWEGNTITLEIPKNEKWDTIRVSKEMSASSLSSLDDIVWERLGIRYVPTSLDERPLQRFRSQFPDGAVRVWLVRPDSPAAAAGIRSGDTIVQIGQWRTSSANAVRWVALNWQHLEAERSVQAKIIRDDAVRSVVILARAPAAARVSATDRAFPLRHTSPTVMIERIFQSGTYIPQGIWFSAGEVPDSLIVRGYPAQIDVVAGLIERLDVATSESGLR